MYSSSVSNTTYSVPSPLRCLQWLLKSLGGILDLSVRDENGDLPTHLATKRGHENKIRWLHERQGFSLFTWNKRD